MIEKKDLTVGVPLPLERAERTAAEEQAPAAKQSLFRGKPIVWLTVPTTKTVVTESAIGDSEASAEKSLHPVRRQSIQAGDVLSNGVPVGLPQISLQGGFCHG